MVASEPTVAVIHTIFEKKLFHQQMDLNGNDIAKYFSCNVIVPKFLLNTPHAVASILSMHYLQRGSFVTLEKSKVKKMEALKY